MAQSIQEIAASVLRTHLGDALTLPVNVELLAVRMGLEPLDTLPDWPSDVSGAYRIENGTPKIYVRRRDPKVRQRFTLAHELGHHVLGHGPALRLDTARQFVANSYEPKEYEANRFAAALLMPDGWVADVLRKEGLHEPAQLAERFGVSEAAILVRLKSLGWLRER